MCWAYRQLGGRDEANRIARLVDDSPRLSTMRFGRLCSIAGGVPFDLAATPKLAARLQFAGLELRPYRTVAERIAAKH